MSLSEREIRGQGNESRLHRTRETLADHGHKILFALLGGCTNIFVEFAASKPLHEQVLYIGAMAGVGALADVVKRGESRSVVSKANININKLS